MQTASVLLALAVLGAPLPGREFGRESRWDLEHEPAVDPWRAPAGRGMPGERREIDCPPNGYLTATVWGADIYTADSAVCPAAVHAGAIDVERGGRVVIEFSAGRTSYDAATRHGVRSAPWRRWESSFFFPTTGFRPSKAREIAVSPEPEPVDPIDDRALVLPPSVNVRAHRGQIGHRIEVTCTADAWAGPVWGSGPYSDDSDVCAAAVHAGVIDASRGGAVTVEIAPALDAYRGSSQNGVRTLDYGRWDGSITFPAAR